MSRIEKIDMTPCLSLSRKKRGTILKQRNKEINKTTEYISIRRYVKNNQTKQKSANIIVSTLKHADIFMDKQKSADVYIDKQKYADIYIGKQKSAHIFKNKHKRANNLKRRIKRNIFDVAASMFGGSQDLDNTKTELNTDFEIFNQNIDNIKNFSK